MKNINIYALTPILTSIISFSLGLFVYFRDRKNIVNEIWGLFSLSIAVWSFGYGLMLMSNNKNIALIWARVSHSAAVFIPILFFHFVSLRQIVFREQRSKIILGYLLSGILLIFNFTPYFIKDVTHKLTIGYYFVPGNVYYFFTGVFFLYIIFGFLVMLSAYKKLSGAALNQVKYELIASLFGFAGGTTTFPLVFDMPLYPFGIFSLALYPIIITYAIVKYRLMDITIALTRATVFILVYTPVLALPFVIGTFARPLLIQILGQRWWIGPPIVSTFLATVGPSIYLWLQRRAEARLLKEQRRYQDTLLHASSGMTRIRELNKLLSLIVHIITKTVRLSCACIYLYNEASKDFELMAVRDRDEGFPVSIPQEDTLVQYLLTKREPIVYEELKQKLQEQTSPTFQEMATQLKSLHAAVVVPSFVEDRLLGFISLGVKLSGAMYTQDDLIVFSVLANQAALAIENAQFYEDIKQTQEQLYQAEKMATIGTMANGLSHQINNRFHALSLIAGDTMDTIKLLNKEGLSQELKDLLEQIGHALQRVQDNVMQGAEVVRGILKYSKPGEGGLEQIRLEDVLNASLEMAQYKVRLGEIDIQKDLPADLPAFKGNSTQLQEVFFNLIDNAYDAIKERQEKFRENGFRGKISISALADNSSMNIVFRDNGIGVRQEDNAKLFTPFFTTKASSRKGTGLGLFVIQKIITANHKGKISVDSEYGKGTAFRIELPLR